MLRPLARSFSSAYGSGAGSRMIAPPSASSAAQGEMHALNKTRRVARKKRARKAGKEVRLR